MKRTVSIGSQSFLKLREDKCFYIDKTDFIKELWDAKDGVTLITRPRRFGKTLNMSMLECFFSNRYAGRSDLFEGLKIWDCKDYRDIQGTYPVIFLSFANAKSAKFDILMQQIYAQIYDVYQDFGFLLEGDVLNETDKSEFNSVSRKMEESVAIKSLNNLCKWLYRYYDKKVIILLDEYDTPMQEAWLSNNWKKITDFFRSFFNATFKTNPYLERAVMTGITRVSKESMFSDLNNLKVITTTSSQYGQYFGFTEEEVFAALDEMGLSDQKEDVKYWYDGFVFGEHRNIYNPWSITNFLDEGEYKPYWVDTSSNKLVGSLLQTADSGVKEELSLLLEDGCIEKKLDEQIVFDQLETNEDAMWSLFVASGYLRIDSYRLDRRTRAKICSLKVTNFETMLMYEKLILLWFGKASYAYNDFVKSLLKNDVEGMNDYINTVALKSFSSFDVGGNNKQPERFYHGFVLGLLVSLREEYKIRSNRESGRGRYDVMLIPVRNDMPAYIIEFKVHNPEKAETLEATLAVALKQIEDMKYSQELISEGIPEENIRKYGFVFDGKTVLIG